MKDTRILKGKEEAERVLQKYNPNLFTEKQISFLLERAKGITFREIAEKEGISKQAIHSRWKEIMSKL
jgi:DNA-binding NarL/FixJ family response regulator